MTIAEFVLFIVVVALLYRAMRPLQRYLEPRLRKFFRSKSKPNESPVIDITDYSKNRNNKDKS
jgi:hypothetical protein